MAQATCRHSVFDHLAVLGLVQPSFFLHFFPPLFCFVFPRCPRTLVISLAAPACACAMYNLASLESSTSLEFAFFFFLRLSTRFFCFCCVLYRADKA